ncbi:hypothetical protein FDP41_011443 [Naegleria fowleri]|uniref:Armadillo repeat-containing domain-containing protein n=1 Tax=Naegleria fowleri TaxID=5763 RepID=A0A6A5BWP8_NAEFO|nr:uncharacterized protein FDP41_011443 [Naegleria fowleri]KAF0982513.1 hypothetical protein FDP41_011443 [Naegleria fowleri]CAG4707686.1 unnamed protein product [Naegleria fowleri]
MSHLLKDISYGPLCLVGGGLALLSYFAIEEFLITKYNRVELYKALQNLNDSNPETREQGILFIFDYIHNKEQVEKKDPAEEKKDILYEHNTLRKCLKLLTTFFDTNTDKTNQCALIIIRELICGPASIERRRHFNMSLKGLPTLFQCCLSDNEKVVLPALRALKSGTTFEVFKKELEDDVPRGSEGGAILLKSVEPEDLYRLASMLNGQENTEILRGVTSILSHISHSQSGAMVLAEQESVVSSLLPLLTSHVDNISKNAVITLANIAKVNFEQHEDCLATGLRSILKTLNNQTKLPQKIAVLEYMSALAQHFATKPMAMRDNIASQLLELKEQCEYLFRLAEAENAQIRDPARVFTQLFTQPSYTSQADTFSLLETAVKQRIKMEQEEKVKKMIQSMRQMGIDIPPHILSTMTPNDIQQLYFQMMQQYGMM